MEPQHGTDLRMVSKTRVVLSSTLIGASFGLMAGASWHSYHTFVAGLFAVLLVCAGMLVGDLSGPNDPPKGAQ